MRSLKNMAKAFGFALAIMTVNVAISFVVMAVYGHVIEPGRTDEYYREAAQRIAPWSSIVAGAALFFAAAYWTAKRGRDRNAMTFALSVFFVYAALDIGIIAAVAGGAAMSEWPIIAGSMTTKAVATILGVLAARKSGRAV